ncbi:serine hydrolase [Brevibacillus fulvus]|uniref:CubicO group peptidase (Beta-lactamase class C family) n=1 Tax=Brevibacillus fulvus TaxID=1125967 RepID=A0A938XW77_9BACL|nr:CubicO group peptidase (beta-lactamase class C family) [Brevibacillus fulvus]
MKKKKTLLVLSAVLSFSLLRPPVSAEPTGQEPVQTGQEQTVQAGTNKKAKPVKNPLRHSWDQPGHSSSVLHPGAHAAAGMTAEPLAQIDRLIEAEIAKKTMPGAVVLIARRGVIVKEQAYGYAARYTDDQFGLMDEPIPMKPDTIFDLASISKLFTATAIMQLYDQGKLKLDDPVAKYIPEFAANGKERVTIRQLLVHTSGFEPSIKDLYLQGTSREDRLQIVFAHPLQSEPGTQYVYSDLNLIVLGALVERISGQRLDQYVEQQIVEPLGMSDTMYNPPERLKKRIAATESQPWTNRPMVWGQVHDEKAWSLDGVAGHAGVFSTARDLAVFAQMMLNKGTYKGQQILSKQSVKLMMENQLPQFPGDDHGLGWELNQGWYMDALGDAFSMGHTGYTGTSIVVSPNNETICILLTNRVHPTRETVSTNPVRRTVARQAALAIPVANPWKDKRWFAGSGDQLQTTLTAEIKLPEGGTLSADVWYRIENERDYGYVEATTDGQNWQSIGAGMTGESDWQQLSWKIPAGTKKLRFRYATDESVNGRGWYLHNPQIFGQNGQPLKANWIADGWTQE